MTPSWEFEPRNTLIFLVHFKVDMLFMIWTKSEENLSIGFVKRPFKSTIDQTKQLFATFCEGKSVFHV